MGRISKGTLFKRNGWWYFKKIEGGKTFCRSCKTRNKEEAEAAAAEFKTGADLPKESRLAAIQEFLRPKPDDPELDAAFEKFRAHPRNIGIEADTMASLHGHWEVLKKWLHGQQKPGSITNCRGRHPGVKRIGQISQSIADEFVAWAKENVAPNTVNKYIATFRRIWTALGALDNPWKGFAKISQPPHQRRALTPQETALLIKTAEGEMRTIFAIGAYTGLRMSDCATVKWEDFSQDLSTVRVKPHKTKNSSGVLVTLPVHHSLKKILSALEGERKGYLTPYYATVPRWKVSDGVMAVFKKCGLLESNKQTNYQKATPVVGFHSLRATFVTSLCEAGAPLAMVQAIVGHVSTEITQMYYRADTERARAFLEKL